MFAMTVQLKTRDRFQHRVLSCLFNFQHSPHAKPRCRAHVFFQNFKFHEHVVLPVLTDATTMTSFPTLEPATRYIFAAYAFLCGMSLLFTSIEVRLLPMGIIYVHRGRHNHAMGP